MCNLGCYIRIREKKSSLVFWSNSRIMQSIFTWYAFSKGTSLEEPHLPSMQSHVLQTTLITAYNLLHGNLNLPLEEFFDAPAVSHLRGYQFKVWQFRFQLARRQAAFAVRVVGLWNRLPPSVAEAPSLNAFKERLDNCWATIFPDLASFSENCFITVNQFTWFRHASAIF